MKTKFFPVVFLCFSFWGYLLAPNDPFKTNMLNKFSGVSTQFPFGTDELGRCVFSRILYGGKVTLGIVILGSVIVGILGTLLGICIGQGGRRSSVIWDSILNAVTAIPPIAYLIIFIGIWGNSISTMLVALTASLILRMVKLVKTLTEIEYRKAYVYCAIAAGATNFRVLFIHILPNILDEIVHFLCLSCAEMILAISGFSFIGLSLGDNTIDWGTMLSDARSISGMRPALLYYPIIFIFLSSLSFNILGKRLEGEGA
ncbi:MAG: ABC transporter permease [Lachnospiraceae bacterium]